MKKSERIRLLEKRCEQIADSWVRLGQELNEAKGTIDSLRAENDRLRKQSLAGRVRSEFAERWGWLGDLVGL